MIHFFETHNFDRFMEAIIIFIIYILNTFNGNHKFNQVRSTIFYFHKRYSILIQIMIILTFNVLHRDNLDDNVILLKNE